MKKTRFVIFCLAAITLFAACSPEETSIIGNEPDSTTVEDNIYQFKVANMQGDSTSLSEYRGKVIMVLNSATQCGYTPQYTDLERMYEMYADQGFVILDFPCNQFGGQAPGSNDDIHSFCVDNYNISFPQFAIIDVNGPTASPLYVWLKEQDGRGDISWNFNKFLIDRQGNVVTRYLPTASMASVRAAVEKLL